MNKSDKGKLKMGKNLQFNINKDYLEPREELLTNTIKEWLEENSIDALVYTFILGDESNLIVDYSFDEKVSEEKVLGLTEQILQRFNIEYRIEEQSDF